MRRFVLTFASALAAQPVTPPTVTTDLATVVSRKLDKTVAIPSDLVAFQSVALFAKVSGFVESIEVDRGSWVRRDQVLAVLVAPELRARTAEAEARLEAAVSQAAEVEAKRVTARGTYERLKAAAATPGVVAGNDLEIAEKSFEAAGASAEAAASGVKAAHAALDAVKDMESYLELRAPFGGIVTERNAHRGSLLGPSGPAVLKLEQVSKLRLVVPVPEIYVGAISPGARVAFQVAAFPDRSFEGVVARSAHSLDVKTRSMMVELDVPNPDRLLAPGMFANVQWPVSRAGASVFVPATAVVRTSERQFVVRVEGGVAEWVDVRRGEAEGDLLEVFGDLHEGETVIRRGNDEIQPGSRVVARTEAR